MRESGPLSGSCEREVTVALSLRAQAPAVDVDPAFDPQFIGEPFEKGGASTGQVRYFSMSSFLAMRSNLEMPLTRSTVSAGVYFTSFKQMGWLAMGLLFYGGVMNVYWNVGVSARMLMEKLLPAGHAVGRMSGVAFIAQGGLLAACA